LGVTERDLDTEDCLLNRVRSGEECVAGKEDDENDVLVLLSVPADPRLVGDPNSLTEGGGVRDSARFTRFERRLYAGVVFSDWLSDAD
jgi:hypothetical protein